MANNETRLNEIEEAFMLFVAMITGQPPDMQPNEVKAPQARFAEIMDGMRDRFTKREEGKF